MEAKAKRIVDLGVTPVLGSRRFRIWSEHVQAHFIIDVAQPTPLIPRSGPAPVMFVTDGNLCFPAAASLSGALAMEPNGPPPIYVVGIGYEISGNGEKAEHHVIRTRDLSPCEDKQFEAMMRRAPAPFTWRDDIVSGGADRFLSFILDELTPWLADNFDIDVSEKALAGISLGGLFVLNTLFTHPESFSRYIAISPAIWWANCYLLELEERYAKQHKDIEADVYMAVGALEEAQDPNAKMVSNFLELTEQMERQGRTSLRRKHDVLEDESHMSVFSPAMSRALRSVFSSQSRDESWANLEAVN